MQEEKQELETLQLPGSPKEQFHENSTAPSSAQNSQETNDNFEGKENLNMNVKPEIVASHIEKSNNEKMNIEDNSNSSPIDKPVQKKADEQAPNNQIMPKSPQSAPYSSHFVLHNVPLVSSVDELASAIKLELKKFGEVVKIESKNKSEKLVDVNISFKHEKDAVIALKSNTKVRLGEQNFALNLTPSFKEYLIKLSSNIKPQSNSQNTIKQNTEAPKPESVVTSNIKPQSNSENIVKQNLEVPKLEPVVNENPVINEEKNVKQEIMDSVVSVVSAPNIELAKPEENKLDNDKKIIIKASSRRKEVPLEIMKPTKSAKSLTKPSSNGKIGSSNPLAPVPIVNSLNGQQNQQNRSRSKSISREKEREPIPGNSEPKQEGVTNAKNERSLSKKSKRLAKKKELRKLRQKLKVEQNKVPVIKEDNNNKEKSLQVEKKVIELKRNNERKDAPLVIKKRAPDHKDHKDSERDNHHHHHHHQHHDHHDRHRHRSQERNTWTDDEFPCEIVCYAVGIPLECDTHSVKDLLQREGFYPHIKMKWKDFEGLDYLKLVFDSKSETQKFLSRPISLYEIPIIVLPKLPNKNPLEMLGYHQLRVESLSGPIETESVYEFLLKYGPITDFLVLDSMNSPTTFLVTFTNNSSKRTLESYYSKTPAVLTDKYGCERQLKLEFNIKPALVVRKKLNMTIINQYKEAKRQMQAPVKQVFEEEGCMNQTPTPNSGMNNFSMQGPMPQINNMISPIPSTRSASFNYSPSKPGYNQPLNGNYMNENPGYFNMQQGGYPAPIYNPNPMNNFPNYDASMMPVYQVPQMAQRFETVAPSYDAQQNQFMGNQMMPNYGNNVMYGNAPYNNNMRPVNNYPGGGNQYSYPNQDGRNNMQYFY